MRSYPVKENPIGSAVSEILRYRHTDTQTSCYFSKRIPEKDNIVSSVVAEILSFRQTKLNEN